MAVHSVHELHYIHRDLKPDNVLIDKAGHLKLSDFGLCKYTQIACVASGTLRKLDAISKLRESIDPLARRRLLYSTVGTPDYIAPEILRKAGYTETVDWWSLGTIFFEMVVGFPPFFSEDPAETCRKILNWKQYLTIPKEAGLSPAATDLIRRLICEPADRLGSRGIEELKTHSFFAGVDWGNLRRTTAPWVPELDSATDTRYFDKFENTEQEPPPRAEHPTHSSLVGYTYTGEEIDELKALEQALVQVERLQRTPGKRPQSVGKRPGLRQLFFR